MDCSVCLEGLVAGSKQAACPYCGTVCCLGCAKQMALMWASAPKCVSCNKAFTSDFMDSTFNKTFRRGPLRIAMVQNLQEQETSLLPQTMDIINTRRRTERARNLQSDITTVFECLRYRPLEPLEPLFVRARDIQAQLHELSDVVSGGASTAKKARVVHERTIKCPKEACLGYAKRGQACGLCGTAVCKDCNAAVANVEALKAHVCNADDKASWALIKEDSKACPKCGTQISKVSGCNQMWCTVAGCNTAFDWATGHVINGRIHNPHYHEWLARNGAAGGAGPGGAAGGPGGPDLECAGPRDVLQNGTARRIYDSLRGLPERTCTGASVEDVQKSLDLKKQTEQWVRALVESADDNRMGIRELGPYGGRNNLTGPYTPDDHQDLRVEYLESRISKKEWATKLSTRETIRFKRDRLTRLVRMFQSAASDLVQKLVHDLEAAAGASGHQVKEKVFTGYDRNYGSLYETRTVVSLKDPALAATILQPFFGACESLRLYFMAEKYKILTDYTDKRALVLWRSHKLDKDGRRTAAYDILWTDVFMATVHEAVRNS
jgi:hypothetical protein